VIPEGFVSLFNGKDLSEWHVSKTARHGRTPDFRVVHGVLLGTQQPYGQGGMLVTDKKFRNFELTLEAKPDWGCDSGIFFRATESGAAYQITMDCLGTGNGNLGRMIGEGSISLEEDAGAARPAMSHRPLIRRRAQARQQETLNRHRTPPLKSGNARTGI